jgi:hypothetical protein
MEYTPDLLIFDLLNIHLYHGWLIDPEERDVATITGTHSYNHIVEIIIKGNETSATEMDVLHCTRYCF